MIVRISRGSFEPSSAQVIAERLRRSADTLIPAVRRLDGLLAYHAGIDSAAGTMVNVSTWRDLDAARQMDGLAEMQALAKEFLALGVQFERPIINYETLWSI